VIWALTSTTSVITSSFSDLDKGAFRRGDWRLDRDVAFTLSGGGNSSENRYYGQKQEDDTYIVDTGLPAS
jgi:hypothetical protein